MVGFRIALTLTLLCLVAATCSSTPPLQTVPARPLPTLVTPAGLPTTFLGVYQQGAGDQGEHRKVGLDLFSTVDGRVVRELALTASNTPVDFIDPSRGPTGDVWFV